MAQQGGTTEQHQKAGHAGAQQLPPATVVNSMRKLVVAADKIRTVEIMTQARRIMKPLATTRPQRITIGKLPFIKLAENLITRKGTPNRLWRILKPVAITAVTRKNRVNAAEPVNSMQKPVHKATKIPKTRADSHYPTLPGPPTAAMAVTSATGVAEP